MRFAAFLFLVLACAGCTKKTDVFVFDCVVFDQKVNAPVVGATVQMSVQRAAGGFNPNFENVGSATTDGNGRFTIDIDKDIFYSFRVEVSDSQHFDAEFNISSDDVPFSTAYSTTFNLEPKAWLKTHVLNQNGSQTVIFSVDAETDACANCCTDNNNIIQGFPVDSIFKCEVYGEQQASVTGTFVDNTGAVHQINESVYVTAFDTAVVNIV
ncbi:MAG: hypothetical protein ACPG5W_12210, partial [Flavobacteriales bacterium]